MLTAAQAGAEGASGNKGPFTACAPFVEHAAGIELPDRPEARRHRGCRGDNRSPAGRGDGPAADDRHLAVMLARSAASSMAFEQEAVFFHHPVDALCVDRGLTFRSPLAL